MGCPTPNRASTTSPRPYVLARGATTPLDICVAGAITQGRQGEALAPTAEMAALGVRLFSDDGVGVQDPSVMRRALRYAKPLGVRLAQHCEDEQLAGGGTMNEGVLSGRLGLTGRPALAEELMVMRDIELVRATGAEMHFLHLSTARSIALVVAARAEGLPVTFEVAPLQLDPRRGVLRWLRPRVQGAPAAAYEG